jgi:hypothetical protein
LALKFEGPIHQGVIKDYAELARLGQLSRARVTQIMNLLNLSAHIQAEILAWTEVVPGAQSVRETTIRALSSEVSGAGSASCGGKAYRPFRPNEISEPYRSKG